eukprot:Skav229471  [mRNA]  locus=scaffold6310:38618:44176:- [translate_table: standard]
MAVDEGEDEIESTLTQLFKAYDLDESGFLSREEFLAIEMRLHYEDGQALLERAKMGPRYHAGIRQALRNIFALFDEWISAQKTVAAEVSDDLDEGWIDEAAFQAADTNGDGVQSPGLLIARY